MSQNIYIYIGSKCISDLATDQEMQPVVIRDVPMRVILTWICKNILCVNAETDDDVSLCGAHI